MVGNVWEWCADWYTDDYYVTAPNRNPTGPSSGEARVLRGGSWGTGGEDWFRCAHRLRDYPDLRWRDYGVRCARVREDSP